MTPDEMRERGRKWLDLPESRNEDGPSKLVADIIGSFWQMNAERCERLDKLDEAIDKASLHALASNWSKPTYPKTEPGAHLAPAATSHDINHLHNSITLLFEKLNEILKAVKA